MPQCSQAQEPLTTGKLAATLANKSPLLDLVHRLNGWRRAASIFPAALLLQHGQREPDVPASSAEVLHAAPLPHYAARPERLQLRTYPALAHTISRPQSAEMAAARQELRRDLNDWLTRFL